MPGVLKLDKPLKEISPLSITDAEGNFREAWSPERCHTSMTCIGMYEASGSLYWCDGLLSLSGWDDDPVLLEKPSMYDVLQAEEILMPQSTLVTPSLHSRETTVEG